MISLERKLRDSQKEIDPLKKQLDESEKLVKELTEVIEKELSQKLKAVVKVVE